MTLSKFLDSSEIQLTMMVFNLQDSEDLVNNVSKFFCQGPWNIVDA